MLERQIAAGEPSQPAQVGRHSQPTSELLGQGTHIGSLAHPQHRLDPRKLPCPVVACRDRHLVHRQHVHGARAKLHILARTRQLVGPLPRDLHR